MKNLRITKESVYQYLLITLGSLVFALGQLYFIKPLHIPMGGVSGIALVTNYICFVPMSASVAFPIVYGCMTGNLPGVLLLILVAVVVLWRHGENIRRIRLGRELRLSYMWNKEKETARMQANYPEEEWDHPEIE